MEHAATTPFFRAIALKRHGHAIGHCDCDCGRLHHFDNCKVCLERRGTAEFLLQAEATILGSTQADRLKYGIPRPASLRWARKVLGIATVTNPDDLPFE